MNLEPVARSVFNRLHGTHKGSGNLAGPFELIERTLVAIEHEVDAGFLIGTHMNESDALIIRETDKLHIHAREGGFQATLQFPAIRSLFEPMVVHPIGFIGHATKIVTVARHDGT